MMANGKSPTNVDNSSTSQTMTTNNVSNAQTANNESDSDSDGKTSKNNQEKNCSTNINSRHQEEQEQIKFPSVVKPPPAALTPREVELGVEDASCENKSEHEGTAPCDLQSLDVEVGNSPPQCSTISFF